MEKTRREPRPKQFDEEIVKMPGKVNPNFLFVGLASSFSDSYFDTMKKIYKDFLYYKSRPTAEKDYKAVHIVFGDSPAGSLKRVLKDMELQDSEGVIHFSDLFSIGPIWRLSDETGLNQRAEWLRNHINYDEDDMERYQDAFTSTVLNIRSIRSNIPIMIWAGDNSHEQTALRFVLYLLREKANNIFIIKTTASYKQLFNMPEAECYPLHTGEIIPEKLRLIYEKNKITHPCTR